MNFITIKRKIQKLSLVKYTLLFFILSLLSTVIFSILFYLLETLNIYLDTTKKPLQNESKSIAVFLLVCIVAPVFETFIAQMLPVEGLKKYFAKKILIVISAAIFGLLHWYSLAYVLNTFFIGLVLALGYVLWDRPNLIHPFWIICIIHSLRNLLSYLI